ncbi:hypothetical protein M422DRAFT_272219 [Sphaerobolus stellatus SS14]|uniref:Uncharacterized protein n=1 Tax=Sphaerobolus stellatus (strain SS14) TaxID=990650 RepID=A0A0C9UC52_SPHS4|nr:hypothetical protein M422DRAFT_272219 [Sphaerobolus stellatus SS14]
MSTTTVHTILSIWLHSAQYVNTEIVVARAFTTSQTAEAHKLLFSRIFDIMEQDTGETVHFQYIHGTGYEISMADGHKGQALGLGLFCKELVKNTDWHCKGEPHQRLCDLTPYEHLAHFYHYCFAHFTRNVTGLKNFVSAEVIHAMMSLALAEPLKDLPRTLQIILNGAWLKDKQEGSPFTLRALYQPLSKIPLDIWKVSPTTSNGNKQVHHSINRDGVKLTMLAGIMHGMQYDTRAMRALVVLLEYRIHTRDQAATHFRLVLRTVTRSVSSHDDIIWSLCNQVLEQERAIDHERIAPNRALEAHTQMEPVLAQLQIEEIRLHELFEELRTAQKKGSGQVEIPQFKYTQQI